MHRQIPISAQPRPNSHLRLPHRRRRSRCINIRVTQIRKGLSLHPNRQSGNLPLPDQVAPSTYLHPIRQQLHIEGHLQACAGAILRGKCHPIQEVREELYIQLELEEPMHRVRIYNVERNDPNFVGKALELTAKVVFGGVGNGYGRGLGFVDYARRLNQMREYNL